MKLARLFVAAVCFSSFASAEQKSGFDTLAEWYAAAKAPAFADTVGTWTGRCFSAKDQTVANGGILFSYTNADNGPGLPSVDRFWVWSSTADEPSAYDHVKSERVTETIESWHRSRTQIRAFLTKDDALSATVHKQTFWLSLRKHGQYLIVKTNNMKVERYCYFFTKLKFD